MAALGTVTAVHADRTLIHDVTVVDVVAGALLPHRDVLIDGDRIEAVSEPPLLARDARQVDGAGLYLLPGLIDLRGEEDLAPGAPPGVEAAARAQAPRSYLMHGFTTVIPESSPQAVLGVNNCERDPDRPEVRAVVAPSLLAWYRDHPPGASGCITSPGLDTYSHLLGLQRQGVSATALVRAVTVEAAAGLGLDDEIGQVRVGMRADLLLVGADPLADVTALGDIRMIIHDGDWETPASLRADHR